MDSKHDVGKSTDTKEWQSLNAPSPMARTETFPVKTDFLKRTAEGECIIADRLQTGQVAEHHGLNSGAHTEGIGINDA